MSDLDQQQVGSPETGEDAETFGLSVRIAEALLFASATPLKLDDLAKSLPAGIDAQAVVDHLVDHYSTRGVNLRPLAGGYAFRTSADLGYLLQADQPAPRRLSRAALEVLAIIAYHQPVTRAEIEEIRGVSTAKGTLDNLLEPGWVRLRGRRRSPGRPVTFGTTPNFLDHFGLDRIDDLPGLEELQGVNLGKTRISRDLSIPLPDDDPDLREDEDPLDDLFAPLDPGDPDPPA